MEVIPFLGIRCRLACVDILQVIESLCKILRIIFVIYIQVVVRTGRLALLLRRFVKCIPVYSLGNGCACPPKSFKYR